MHCKVTNELKMKKIYVKDFFELSTYYLHSSFSKSLCIFLWSVGTVHDFSAFKCKHSEHTFAQTAPSAVVSENSKLPDMAEKYELTSEVWTGCFSGCLYVVPTHCAQCTVWFHHASVPSKELLQPSFCFIIGFYYRWLYNYFEQIRNSLMVSEL